MSIVEAMLAEGGAFFSQGEHSETSPSLNSPDPPLHQTTT